VSRIVDAAGRYVEFCKSTLSSKLNLQGKRIVVDCAHGATYHIAPKVFRELGADVIEIGVEPNGININEQVGSTSPEQLQRVVVEQSADFGVAYDGDGDRLIMVDEHGETVDGDELVFIVARHRQKQGTLKGGVVGTLMSNFGLELAMQALNIPFIRAAVGDRYVLAALRENGWDLGGESSGHLLCLDVVSTGDGIVSSLQVIGAMLESEQTLGELKKGMSKLPQLMINVRCDAAVVNSDTVLAAVAQTEQKLAGKGRVLLRPSGTEPVVRVMVEGEDSAQVEQLARQLAAVVEAAG
jgi:phosphoglucosamine mutase